MNSLNKEIIRLAVPSIVANITVPLVGMVDIAVAGHLGLSGSAAPLIGGITIGSMMFDLLYWNFGFLRAGTGGLTAQAYGRGDMCNFYSILSKGLVMAGIIAVILLALQLPFAKLVSHFVKTSEAVMALAIQYFFIRIWAAPATLSLMAFKGWFIGMQDSVCAMFSDLVVNGVNIAASIILSTGIPFLGFEGIGFSGIAWGTVIAQYCGLVFVLGVLAIKYHPMKFGFLSKDNIWLGGNGFREFLSLNSDLFIRSLCLIVIYIGYTVISARYGELLLATASIMMKLLMLFSYFTDGFAFAGEALTGKYIGRNNRYMASRAVRGVFLWSMSIGLAFTMIYIFAGEPILKVMTNDTEVIATCGKYFIWLLAMPIVGCAAFTFDGIYIGATASKALRNASILAVAAFFSVWFSLIPFSKDGYMAIHFLMAAYFAHLAARTIYQSIVYKSQVLSRAK